MDNEDRIIRELREFLSIPNIASDTPNIQKNAAHVVEMLEARGIETHLLPISGRGPVVFGKLSTPEAKRTVIFYAHYDGQPVDPAAWTDERSPCVSLDRKSTRLNSSHSQISYAVFCLKKKIQPQHSSNQSPHTTILGSVITIVDLHDLIQYDVLNCAHDLKLVLLLADTEDLLIRI